MSFFLGRVDQLSQKKMFLGTKQKHRYIYYVFIQIILPVINLLGMLQSSWPESHYKFTMSKSLALFVGATFSFWIGYMYRRPGLPIMYNIAQGGLCFFTWRYTICNKKMREHQVFSSAVDSLMLTNQLFVINIQLIIVTLISTYRPIRAWRELHNHPAAATLQ